MEMEGRVLEFSNTRLLMKKFFLFMILILILGVFFIPIHKLYLIEKDSGEILKSFSIKNGEEFTICFIHSVERTPWHEIYYIKNDNEIYLKETIFYSFGAGLPSTTRHDFSFENEAMKITNYHTKMENLVYKIGAVIADHTIIIKGRKLHLNTIAEASTSILLQADKIPLYKYLVREVTNIV